MTNLEKISRQGGIWWVTLLKGVLLVIIGIWILSTPKESFKSIAFVIGLIILLGGLGETFLFYSQRKKQSDWGWNILGGVLDIALGILLMINPMTVLVIITLFISFWLIFFSILVIRKSISMKQLGSINWRRNLILGVAMLLLAVVLIWHPQVVGITMMFWLAFSFISFGAFRIILAFQGGSLLKKAKGQAEAGEFF